MQRAEREAEITVSDAEARVGQLNADYRTIWDERQRLLEEMRQLADDVLGVADDAADRIAPPREPDPITEENETVAGPETEGGEAAEAPASEDPTQVVEPQTPAAQAPPKPS